MNQRLNDISDADLKGIFAMAKLAETRDSDMEKHLERVRTFCLLLAEKLGTYSGFKTQINKDFKDNIYRASPLHDIGKAAIPDHILIKRGRLTEEEFTIIQTHADHGAQTLETIKREYPGSPVLSMGIEISRSHHEKWDGSGYPNGLLGESIPLSARIMAVADVYDALSFARCYKPAYSHEYSSEIILQKSGTHFDPDVVGAFEELQDEFRESRERMD
ncbi:MAG: HD domain-containing phosphohydrolase [Acidobacteriota bacterium]